jgi:hypothetical protein
VAEKAPEHALADLTEVSSQVREAVLFDEKGTVAASTIGDDERSQSFVRAVQDLVAAASEAGGGAGERVAQLEAATDEGSVFVVREGPSYVAATTGPEPTVALVFYDLKTALRAASAEAAKNPARRTRRKPAEGDGDAA